MKNKYIIFFLIIIVLVIAGVIVFDNKSNKPGNIAVNPFEYDFEGYESIDDSLISHAEKKQINLNAAVPKALEYKDGKIYLLADDYLQIIRLDGTEVSKKRIGEGSECLVVFDDLKVLVAFKDHLVLLDNNLVEIKRSEISEKSLYSALAFLGNKIFAADAALKQVTVFNNDLIQTNSFKGESGVSDQHGFIIPSLHFDLAVNEESELWVVNPGLHALQNYTNEGKLRGYWSNTSFKPEGFSGCCNPFYIAFLSDGSFVTSEKGLIRIKIHKSSGELISVVASPDSFKGGSKAPDITVDENDNIIALDFDKKMIRFFEPKP